ncbi:MAG: Cof-type HAD-IIB family hydrolase [Synergistes sp.]|nr:Cof-type HAD-IIB family hydrolase [Synergistes sp.]
MKIPKLIALDMDGTILNGEGRISPRTKAALAAAQDKGIYIVIATGRMYPSAMQHIKDAGIRSASIFYNGALIRDTGTDRTIYEQGLGVRLTAELLAFFKTHGWYVQIYSDDKLIVYDDTTEECKYYENICGQKAIALGSDFWTCGIDSSKMLGVAFDKDEFHKMFDEIRRVFGSRVYSATSWGAFVEIVNPAVNKAFALRRVCEHYGVSREDVVAFGDGSNDKEMIEWAGTGVAMGNSGELLKEAADIVAPPNTEDGAAVIMESILNI